MAIAIKKNPDVIMNQNDFSQLCMLTFLNFDHLWNHKPWKHVYYGLLCLWFIVNTFMHVIEHLQQSATFTVSK